MRGLGAMILVGMLMLQGCAVVAVGLLAGAGAGVTYTVLGIAEKTFNEDYDSVAAALQKALVSLDIKTGDTRKIEESGKVVKMEIEAFSRDLKIQISVERVSDKATKVSVDANKNYLIKDKATANQILNQVSENLAKKS